MTQVGRGVYLYMCECVKSRLYTCAVTKDMAKYGVFVQHVVTFWLYSVCGVICTTDDFVGVSMYMTLTLIILHNPFSTLHSN